MNDKTPSQVYSAIAADLKANQMTYNDVAHITGYKTQTIANIMCRKKYMSAKQARIFSDSLGYNADFLLYGKGVLRKEDDIIKAVTSGNSFLSDRDKLMALMEYVRMLSLITRDDILSVIYKKFYRAITSEDSQESYNALMEIQGVLALVAEMKHVHFDKEGNIIRDEDEPYTGEEK